jgi:3-oxoacyl-[acyl-carrier protein] reductase
MPDLTGKTALVTGASRGIGQAIARRLAEDGAQVAVHYSGNVDGAKETVEAILASGGEAFSVHAEFGVDGDVDLLLEQVWDGLAGRSLDILVNNAAWFGGTVEDVTPETFDLCCATNMRAPLFLILQALPRMSDGGHIVNLSSSVTRMVVPEIAYSMSKGAIDVMTRSLAPHLGKRNITINAVSPGVTDTRWNAWVHTDEDRAGQLADMTALGRVGEPEDIAAVVAFLASDEARWVTGHVLDASGGIHL